MRADARANREALLDAARRLYADRGTSVPFSAIAAEAGVGIGTLYRHFPTPDDLVLGLVQALRDRIAEIAGERSAQMDLDPVAGWTGFVGDLVDLELGALMPRLAEGRDIDDLPPALAEVRQSILAEVATVLALAQRTGQVRGDVTPVHFQVGIGAFTRPLPTAVLQQVPDLRSWLAEVYVAGLRPTTS